MECWALRYHSWIFIQFSLRYCRLRFIFIGFLWLKRSQANYAPLPWYGRSKLKSPIFCSTYCSREMATISVWMITCVVLARASYTRIQTSANGVAAERVAIHVCATLWHQFNNNSGADGCGTYKNNSVARETQSESNQLHQCSLTRRALLSLSVSVNRAVLASQPRTAVRYVLFSCVAIITIIILVTASTHCGGSSDNSSNNSWSKSYYKQKSSGIWSSQCATMIEE